MVHITVYAAAVIVFIQWVKCFLEDNAGEPLADGGMSPKYMEESQKE